MFLVVHTLLLWVSNEYFGHIFYSQKILKSGSLFSSKIMRIRQFFQPTHLLLNHSSFCMNSAFLSMTIFNLSLFRNHISSLFLMSTITAIDFLIIQFTTVDTPTIHSIVLNSLLRASYFTHVHSFTWPSRCEG